MQQLTPDRHVDATLTIQARKLRQEISRCRGRLLELDHPETVRVFEMLMRSAQTQLDQIERTHEVVLIGPIPAIASATGRL